jgi:hypothetical protein
VILLREESGSGRQWHFAYAEPFTDPGWIYDVSTITRHIIIVDSDTESDAEGDYPYNDEESSVVENQAGYLHEGILSSPPLASENIGHNESNRDNDGEFHLKQRYVQTESLISRSSLRSSGQCNEAEEGNSSGVMNTDIVLSLGSKARTNSLWLQWSDL